MINNYAETCTDPCVGDNTQKITCVGSKQVPYYRLRQANAFEDADGYADAFVPYEGCPDPIDVSSCDDMGGQAVDFQYYESVTDEALCDGDLSPVVRRKEDGTIDVENQELCER